MHRTPSLTVTALLAAAAVTALAGPAAAAPADPFSQIAHIIADSISTGSVVPLPPCTPGTVTDIGCEPN